MTLPRTNLRAELEERLRFETLIADLSSKFVNLPPSLVDREIMDAERLICEALGLDLSALWQWSDEGPGSFTLTHFYSAQEGP
jgi:formate hydrogenlyase transcriptional activator